jgi:hypothetical protein
MDNKQALVIIGAQLSIESTIINALTMAQTLLTDGYQSDQEAITAGIAVGIDATVKAATDPLNDQIVTLTRQITDAQTALTTEQTAHATDNTTNEATITTLTQQVTDLTAQVANLTPAASLDTATPAVDVIAPAS